MQKVQNNGEHHQTIQTLCFEFIKSGKFLSQKRLKKYRKRLYAWSTEENYLYMSYLKTLTKYFHHTTMAKMFRLFSRMSKMIKTRSPNQIKSHHQKMMMKYKSIQNVIKNIELELSYQLYESQGLFAQVKDLSTYTDDYLKRQKKENSLKKLSHSHLKKQSKMKREELSESQYLVRSPSCNLNITFAPQKVKVEEDEEQIYKFVLTDILKNAQASALCKIETQ